MGQDPDKARLDSLGRRLDEVTQDDATQASGPPASAKQMNAGMRVVSELIAGIGGGALFGWLFDHWLGTSPWFLLTLLLLGTAAAFRNIIVRFSRPTSRPDQRNK